MAIRFKFRSSPNFDTVEIGQQSTISIRDLKSKIVLKKHLNLSHDFDLVFSDSLSGTEFTDENTQIASGSSVIIKRVPAKSSPLLRESDVLAGHAGSRDADYVNVAESPVLDFAVNDCDDYAADLCPLPDANLSKLPSNMNEKNDYSSLERCFEKLPVTAEKLDGTPPTRFDPKDYCAYEGSTVELQHIPIIKGQTKFHRTIAEKQPDLEDCHMPSELKCSLCTTYFKEAVMIPCCQYSFCEKCIRLALVKNSRCPMCFSTKCKPEDLLPNISLRQTTNRFLESQSHNVSEKNLDRYAPDGESGIQMKELSYAGNVPPRDQRLNQSAIKVSAKLMGNPKCNPLVIENYTEFEGENEPPNIAGTNEEANSCIKKGQAFGSVTGGGERNFITPCRLNKGFRTCYMCGSPDHLIRECPVAASSHSGNWNGNVPFQGVLPAYAPQYWPGNPSPSRPLYNMFYGPEMMLYNANMAAATPFGLSPYASPMFSGYPFTSGSFTLGGMAPPSGINVHQMGQSDPMGFMGCVKQRGSCAEAFEREEVIDWDRNAGWQHVPNDSGDKLPKRSEENYRSHEPSVDDKYLYEKRQERITHSSEGNLRNAQSSKTTSERAKPDGRICPPVSRRNEETVAENDSDSSQYCRYSRKDGIKRTRREQERRSDRDVYNHSGSGVEPSYSSSDGRRRRDKSSHKHRRSDIKSKPSGKDVYHERGRTIRYSDDDYQDDYHSRKRKRYH